MAKSTEICSELTEKTYFGKIRDTGKILQKNIFVPQNEPHTAISNLPGVLKRMPGKDFLPSIK